MLVFWTMLCVCICCECVDKYIVRFGCVVDELFVFCVLLLNVLLVHDCGLHDFEFVLVLCCCS